MDTALYCSEGEIVLSKVYHFQKSALDLNYHGNYQLYQKLATRYPVLEYYSCSIAVNLQRYRGLVNIQFSKILELISRPELARDHESGLRSDRGPVVLRDFSNSGNHHTIF